MAKMIQIPYEVSISVPVETAQAVQDNRENPISLEALGLLVNLLSYPTTWELHKTELYKRFGKNKESSVRSAWNDLVKANYIIEFKYRVGKKWEYVYYFRKVPFTDEEKAKILETATIEYGGIWRLDFQEPKAKFEDLIFKTSKSRGNQKNKLKQKNKLNNINKNIDYIDDDKRISQQVGKDSATHNEESINLIISNFRQATKGELTERSFKAVVRKVIDKYNQGKVNSFRDYLATALTRKMEELEIRKEQAKAKEELSKDKQRRLQQKANKLRKTEISHDVVFYNWLEE
ncbi:hypothetical protein NST89_18500 [Caldifermentibacillus hisashii]|uniref:hypothetical protein n=1 Tax=Caldifermentibacillus hisashii TaxID=996558 RepID=UPI0031373A9B